jgi:tellurite resistance protein TerC
MQAGIFFWIVFNVVVFTVLALDLGVFNKKAHKISVREALIIFVFLEFGKTKALQFLTGYVIEYSLSVDNIFVFILIFSYFSVKAQYQHKILFWGILGALIMRGIFIFAGITLINKFHWIVLIFGGFLIYSGIKMLFQK